MLTPFARRVISRIRCLTLGDRPCRASTIGEVIVVPPIGFAKIFQREAVLLDENGFIHENPLTFGQLDADLLHSSTSLVAAERDGASSHV